MVTKNRVFVAVFILFAVINLIDFAFYGQNLRNLAGSVGFSLMAYGHHKEVHFASIAGAVLALGSIVVKYLA
jgi:hypothetical protein